MRPKKKKHGASDFSSLSSEVAPGGCPANHKSRTQSPSSWIRLFVFTTKSHITSSNYADMSKIPPLKHVHRSLSAATSHPCWPIKWNWRVDCHAVTAGCSCTARHTSHWHLRLFVLLKGSSSRIYFTHKKGVINIECDNNLVSSDTSCLSELAFAWGETWK